MKKSRLLAAALALVAASASTARTARADIFTFNLSGAGVSGTVTVTYGPGTDARYPNAFQATGASGTFTATGGGLNILGAMVQGVVPLNRQPPEPTNHLAPADFSHFDVASGLDHGFISYDNLVWPGGSPQTATDYPGAGGFADIYGLLLDIGGGRVLNVWSNGDFGGGADYGVAVVTRDEALGYIEGGVVATVTPEPASLVLVGVGLAGVVTWRRRKAA